MAAIIWSRLSRPARRGLSIAAASALIAGMLGRGMALPDCTLVSCGVDHTVIEATYSCVDGDVTLEFGHPQNAPAQTAQFSITVQSGTAPPDLQSALVSLIRAREAGFVWGWQESASAAENDAAPE